MEYYFHTLAQQEYLEQVKYYATIQHKLGGLFIEYMQQTIDSICSNPQQYIVETNNIRKAIVDKFPFYILFDVNNNTVRILAIAHFKREPKYWMSRKE
jgi:hypothetical protein